MNHRTLILVNLCLAGIVCLLGFKVYSVWSNTYTPSASVVRKVRAKPPNPRPHTYPEVSKPRQDYDIIVEKNLFSENRSCNQGTESLIPPSQMVLHGCFIYGEHKVAVLEAQQQEKKQVRRGKTTETSHTKESKEVAVGDTIVGYQVAKILEDKVILKDASGKTCIVQIEIPKQRSHVRTQVSKARKRKVPKRRSSRKTPARSRRTRK